MYACMPARTVRKYVCMNIDMCMHVVMYVCLYACKCTLCACKRVYLHLCIVRRGGALVESEPFDRNVVGSNPALAGIRRNLGQVFNSQLLWGFAVKLRHSCIRAVS